MLELKLIPILTDIHNYLFADHMNANAFHSFFIVHVFSKFTTFASMLNKSFKTGDKSSQQLTGFISGYIILDWQITVQLQLIGINLTSHGSN